MGGSHMSRPGQPRTRADVRRVQDPIGDKGVRAMSNSDPSNRHLGSFAEGECEPEAHPEERHVGTFVEGEE